jgi:hypothetical protein
MVNFPIQLSSSLHCSPSFFYQPSSDKVCFTLGAYNFFHISIQYSNFWSVRALLPEQWILGPIGLVPSSRRTFVSRPCRITCIPSATHARNQPLRHIPNMDSFILFITSVEPLWISYMTGTPTPYPFLSLTGIQKESRSFFGILILYNFPFYPCFVVYLFDHLLAFSYAFSSYKLPMPILCLRSWCERA